MTFRSRRLARPRLGLVAAAATMILLAGPPAMGSGLLPNASGLPWSSGATIPNSNQNVFGIWRGARALDVRTTFFAYKSWRELITSAIALRSVIRQGSGRQVVAVGMLPTTHALQHAECAAGQFDAEIRAVTAAMLAQGAQAARDAGAPIAIRLGWEANGPSFPWRATGDGLSWRDCFRRWVDILNPIVDEDGDPATPPVRQRRFLMVWNMANRGSFDLPIDNLWPGGDRVDIVGSQFYDRCPPLPAGNEVEWERRLNLRSAGGNPAGPQGWLDYARSKGKPYAVPEWGVGGPSDVCARPGIDNPYFIRKMYEFFWLNTADIAFEAYYNGHGGLTDALGSHMLLAPVPLDVVIPPGVGSAFYERYNPLSAAAYRTLWGAATEPQPPELPGTPPPATDTLYWLRYVASYPDLMMLIGADATRAAAHWRSAGRLQGRTVRFDPVAYLDRNPDLKRRFRNDWTVATRHYITVGSGEGL